MPELPEVETLCRQLQEQVAGARIRSMSVYDPRLDGIKDLRGRIIREVKRSGKTIHLILDDHRSVAIHLRMTGRLFMHNEKTSLPHGRWRLAFEECNLELVDPRRFATVKIIPTRKTTPHNDLIVHFSEKKFMESQAKRKVNIKRLLMDPAAFAGIGNIYACEILHASGIAPERRADNITNPEWKRILSQARKILKKGIEKRGTSISDWRDLYGRPGENQSELKSYGQEGKRCRRCGGVIVRMKQGGRSTFYCPKCQK